MKLLTERNLRTLLLIGMGIYFIVEQATRNKPGSLDDLTDFSGRLSHYSFEDNSGFRGQGDQYYLYLEEYSNKFQLKADYLRFFNKLQFEQNFKKGSRVKLSIPNYQEHLIGTDEAVYLTSLSINPITYLTKQQSVQFETSERSGYALGTIFIVFGILSLVFDEQSKKLLASAE